MYFYFLTEDESSKILIEVLMAKVQLQYPDVLYECKSFRGIGGFTKKNTVKETKTGKLLNDLTTYLKGFDKALRGIKATAVVVVDNDDRETEVLKEELKEIVRANGIQLDHIFAIAVEEIEAWLLGDKKAVLEAYPGAKKAVLNAYIQDSICGTWELLANAIYPGGLAKMHKECPSYREKGKKKAEWSKNIGMAMDIQNNLSPSFNYFMGEVLKRC